MSFPARRALSTLLSLAITLIAPGAWANAGGANGFTGAQPGITCNQCHNGGGAPAVTLAGPTTLTGGTSGTYTLRIAGGTRNGFNIAVNSKYATLTSGTANTVVVFGELTHSAPLGGNATITFQLAGPSIGGLVRIFAAGLAANGDGGTGGDSAGFATLDVNVVGAPGAPLIDTLTVPRANVTAATAPLSVVALDDAGEPALNYTWAVATGPGQATFTPNGTNAAKATAARFTAPGDYTLSVVVRDATGASTMAVSETVKVVAAPSAITVTPTTVGLPVRGTQQFTAVLLDQFKNRWPVQPQSFTWSLPFGGGRITTDGVFTADANPYGPFPLTASTPHPSGTGQIASAASITIGSGTAPTIAQAPSAQASGSTATLSVLGADDAGESGLRYLWEIISGPGTVEFSVNDSNAAKSSVATFGQSGRYVIGVTIKDAAALTAFASFELNVGGIPVGSGGGNGNGGQVGSGALAWVRPTTGQTLSGQAELEVSAAGVSLTQASFLLDGAAVASANGALAKVSFDTCRYSDGQHTLAATGRDANGNSVQAGELSIRIANNGAGTCQVPPSNAGALGGCAATGGGPPAAVALALVLLGLTVRARRRRA